MNTQHQVMFRCYTCASYNKHHRDDPDYDPRPVLYESLSEIWNGHILNGHHVEAELATPPEGWDDPE